MKKINFKLSFILAFLIITVNLFAQEKSITGKEFASFQKGKKDLVIVDARKATDYAKMHIMEAVNVPYTDLSMDGKVEGLLKNTTELADYFAKNGIANTTPVVIYDDGSSKYSSRVYWILKYLGAENVYLLHKDMAQWKMGRIRLTRTATPVKKASFTPKVNNSIFADMKAVQSVLRDKSATIIDVRDADEYDGSSDKSKGHIPGAVNIPYKEVLKANGDFKSKAELEALVSKYKLDPEKEIIVYCVTSVRASVVFFALKNILGFENVKAFDGAYNEWVSNPANPLD